MSRNKKHKQDRWCEEKISVNSNVKYIVDFRICKTFLSRTTCSSIKNTFVRPRSRVSPNLLLFLTVNTNYDNILKTYLSLILFFIHCGRDMPEIERSDSDEEAIFMLSETIKLETE